MIDRSLSVDILDEGKIDQDGAGSEFLVPQLSFELSSIACECLGTLRGTERQPDTDRHYT